MTKGKSNNILNISPIQEIHLHPYFRIGREILKLEKKFYKIGTEILQKWNPKSWNWSRNSIKLLEKFYEGRNSSSWWRNSMKLIKKFYEVGGEILRISILRDGGIYEVSEEILWNWWRNSTKLVAKFIEFLYQFLQFLFQFYRKFLDQFHDFGFQFCEISL